MKTRKEIEKLADEWLAETPIKEWGGVENGIIIGYTKCQEDMKPLLNDLFDLWERLAEVGDLSIGLNFNKKYDELKNLINKQEDE